MTREGGYPNIVTLKRSRWVNLARRTQELNRSIVSSVLGTVLVLDGSGKIVGLNRPQGDTTAKYASTIAARARLGDNFLRNCQRAAEQGSEYGQRISAGVSSVLNRTTLHFATHYKPDPDRKSVV